MKPRGFTAASNTTDDADQPVTSTWRSTMLWYAAGLVALIALLFLTGVNPSGTVF